MPFQTSYITCDKNLDNLLIVSGSVNPVSIGQINKAKQNGYLAFNLTPFQMLSLFAGQPERLDKLIKTVVSSLTCHKRVILVSVSEHRQIAESEEYSKANGMIPGVLPHMISRVMGYIVKRVLKKTPIGNLAVFGGDTLFGIMEELGCDGILPVLEISPGIVAAKTTCPAQTFRLVTKAGGFGGEDAVSDIERYIFEE